MALHSYVKRHFHTH